MNELPHENQTDISEEARERLEKVAEMRDWLKRKVGDLRDEPLREIYLFVQGVAEMHHEQDLKDGREGGDDEDFLFENLMNRHPESFFENTASFYWLMTDDNGFIKKLPIADAAEVLEEVFAERTKLSLRNEARDIGRNNMQREREKAA